MFTSTLYRDLIKDRVRFIKIITRFKVHERILFVFLCAINNNVIGGASKLLNYFIKTYQPTKIISYADRSWSEGHLYYKLGFSRIAETNPDYKYIVNGVKENKIKYKKSKLIFIKGSEFLTEKQIMKNLGHYRIYDCGKLKFEMLFNL